MLFERISIGKRFVIKKCGGEIERNRLSHMRFDWMVLFEALPKPLPKPIDLVSSAKNVELYNDGDGYCLTNYADEAISSDSNVLGVYTIKDTVHVITSTQMVVMKRDQMSPDHLEDDKYLKPKELESRNTVMTRKRRNEMDQLDSFMKSQKLDDEASSSSHDHTLSTSHLVRYNSNDIPSTSARYPKKENMYDKDEEGKIDYENAESLAVPFKRHLNNIGCREEDDEIVQESEPESNGFDLDATVESEDEIVTESAGNDNSVSPPSNSQGFDFDDVEKINEINDDFVVVETINNKGEIVTKNAKKSDSKQISKQSDLDKQFVRKLRINDIRQQLKSILKSRYNFNFSLVNSNNFKFTDNIENPEDVDYLTELIKAGENLENGDPIIVRQNGPQSFVVLNGRRRARAYSSGIQRMVNVAVMTEEDYGIYLLKQDMFEKKKTQPFNAEKITRIQRFIHALKVQKDEALNWKLGTIFAIFGKNTSLSTQIFRACLDDRLSEAISKYIGDKSLPISYVEKIVATHRKNSEELIKLLETLPSPPELNKLAEALKCIEPNLLRRLELRGVPSKTARDFIEEFQNNEHMENFILNKWPNRNGRNSKKATVMEHWHEYLEGLPSEGEKRLKTVEVTNTVQFDIAVLSHFNADLFMFAQNHDKVICTISLTPPSYSASTLVVLPEQFWKLSKSKSISNAITVYFVSFKNKRVCSESDFVESFANRRFKLKDVVTLEELCVFYEQFDELYFGEEVDKRIAGCLANACSVTRTPVRETAEFISNVNKLNLQNKL